MPSNHCNYHDHMSTLLVYRRIQTVDSTCSYTSNRPSHSHEWCVYQQALNDKEKKKYNLCNRNSIPYNTLFRLELTLVHRELDDLFDFSTKRIFDTFLVIAAFDGQIFWWYVLGATCIVVTVAFIATNSWTYYELQYFC